MNLNDFNKGTKDSHSLFWCSTETELRFLLKHREHHMFRPITTSRKPWKRWMIVVKEPSPRLFGIVLYGDIVAPSGACQYAFFLEAVEIKPSEESEKPNVEVIGYVTSEKLVSLFGDDGTPQKYVLGRFHNGTHFNYGFKVEWGDLDTWLPKAKEHAKEMIGVPELQDLEWVLDYDFLNPDQV